MRLLYQSVFLVFLSLTISCNNTAQTKGSVGPEEYEIALKQNKVQLLDTRTAGEYRASHIEGALQADWLNVEEFASRTAHLDKNKPVYVYCQSGARAAEAANYLREKGFKEVVNLKGGMSAWRRAGKPAVADDPAKKQTSYQEFDALTKTASLVLVDFGAEWCPPCKKMEPVLNAFMLEQGSKVKLLKLDGGNEIALMQSLKVEALPTFILYNNGKETKRLQGVMTKEELDAWVK